MNADAPKSDKAQLQAALSRIREIEERIRSVPVDGTDVPALHREQRQLANQLAGGNNEVAGGILGRIRREVAAKFGAEDKRTGRR